MSEGPMVASKTPRKMRDTSSCHIGEIIALKVEVIANPHDSSVLYITGQWSATENTELVVHPSLVPGNTYIEDDLVEELHCIAAEHQRHNVPVNLAP
ncbi:hypothetical protein BN1723_013929 [Verticillium longisporum]|uniref:Uncharacterized protein n=1 Tax=Verticillium longisporum TaxID=100787 RepID=A0A0G4LYE1_VERLO|nr:hypothetical protein BN1723_013929 [Verticillium longisporum]